MSCPQARKPGARGRSGLVRRLSITDDSSALATSTLSSGHVPGTTTENLRFMIYERIARPGDSLNRKS